MSVTSARIVQFVSVLVVEAMALLAVAYFHRGIQINTLWAAIAVVIAASVGQAIFWWVFIQFLGRLPVILYPILTFVFTGAVIAFISNFIPGIFIDGWGAGLIIILTLTAVNAILGAIFSLDEDLSFDRNVTLKMVQRHGTPTKSDIPGFLYLEIDGLSEDVLYHALRAGYVPTLNRWLKSGNYRLIGWETDFTAQTGAMQSGILLGNNDNIPAYRWWDRAQGRMVMSGNPFDAQAVEARLTRGRGLLTDGGASRGNMFSGDAGESIMTLSTLLNPERGMGPGFYSYLLNPYVIFRLLSRYCVDVVREWFQQLRQWLRRDPYRVSARNPLYAFFRGLLGPIVEDVTTFAVISDILRGVPAVYALYPGYDDVAHFAGMKSKDALGALRETDHHFARIERTLRNTPRPYHLVVLSDHGQSQGLTFERAYGISLNQLIEKLVAGDADVLATLDTNEGWNHINAFLSESVNAKTRTASVFRRALKSKMENGVVAMGPGRGARHTVAQQAPTGRQQVIVFGSGCTGLIYFGDVKQRMTYEQIVDRYPDLIVSLVRHPGIGWVLVKSATRGTMVMGKDGINFLDLAVVEGKDPLGVYGPNAAQHLRRQSSFEACPDLLVNTTYDPITQELAGFENQVCHHGGLGGPQNSGFIIYPASFPYDGAPIVGAENVYKLLRGWRDSVHGTPVAQSTARRGAITENLNEHVVVAFFESEAQADSAAQSLMAWDKANEDIKLGAIGVLTRNAEGKLQTRRVGPRNTGRGARIGTILGVTAGILSGGLSLLGGALAGGAIGAATGSLSRESLGITEADFNGIGERLQDGRAALVVLCDDEEIEATLTELRQAGGDGRHYGVNAAVWEATEREIRRERGDLMEEPRRLDPMSGYPM